MYTDEFDQFVYSDAIERRSLKGQNAHAQVEYYVSWIHHAIVRLSHTENDAEFRAANAEIEQDIRHMQARLGWDSELLLAYRRRRDEAMAGRANNDATRS
jgi:hypothetical protein